MKSSSFAAILAVVLFGQCADAQPVPNPNNFSTVVNYYTATASGPGYSVNDQIVQVQTTSLYGGQVLTTWVDQTSATVIPKPSAANLTAHPAGVTSSSPMPTVDNAVVNAIMAAAMTPPIATTLSPQSIDPMTEAQISLSAAGNTAVVAAGTTTKTKFYRLTVSCQSPTVLTIEDGSTAKLGPYYLGAYGSLVLDNSGIPWVTGSTNTALNINLSVASNCGGSISYVQS